MQKVMNKGLRVEVGTRRVEVSSQDGVLLIPLLNVRTGTGQGRTAKIFFFFELGGLRG